MADNLISEIISEEAFKQLERLQADLKENLSLFEANVKSAVNFNSVLKGAEGAKELNAILQNQAKIMSDLSVSQNGVLQSQQKLAAMDKIAADLKTQYNGHTKEHIANMDKLAKQSVENAKASEIESKASLNNSKAKVEESKATTEAARTKTEEAKASEINSREKINESKVTVNNAKAKTEEAKAAEIALRIKERENKVNREVADGYKAVLNELRAAENAYRAYAAAVRAGTEAEDPKKRAELLKGYNSIRNFVVETDKALSIYNRNVGNYSSAFSGLSVNMQQILRELPSLAINANTFFLAISNNLPMFFDAINQAKEEIKKTNEEIKKAAAAAALKAKEEALAAGATKKAAEAAANLAEKQELANNTTKKAPSIWKMLGSSLFSFQTLLSVGVTLLTLYGGKIIEWVKSLDTGNVALKKAREEQDALAKAQESANRTAGEQVGRLAVLEKILESTTTSVKDKKAAYKEVIDQYPEYKKQLQDEYERTGNLANVIRTVLIPAIIASAQARAYETRIQDLSAKNIDNLDKQKKQFIELRKAKQDYDRELATPQPFQPTTSIGPGIPVTGSMTDRDKARANYNTVRNAAIETTAAIFDNTKQINEYASVVADLASKGAKVTKTETDKAKDTTSSYNKDIEKQIELLRKNASAAIELQKGLALLGDSESARTRAMQLEIALEEQIRKKRTDKKKLTAAEMELIETDYQNNINKIQSEYLKDIYSYDIKRREKFESIEKEMTQVAITEAQKRKDAEIDDATKKYNASDSVIKNQQELANRIQLSFYKSGKLSKQEYEDSLAIIEQQALKKRLKLQADYYWSLLQMGNLSKEDQEKNYSSFTAAIDGIRKIDTDNEVKAVGEKNKLGRWLSKEENRAKVEALNMAIEVGKQTLEIFKASIQSQIQVLQEKGKAIDDAHAKEVDAINATSLSEEDKNIKIRILDADTAAKKKQLAEEEKQLKIKQARFDRAQSIANIVQSTANAIVNALATSGPPWIGIVMAALVGAMGAAQLATVIAQPLPAYKYGRKGGKAEIALVGEAGAERVEHPDGTQYYVDKPTITYLPEHAKVIPNHELQREQMNRAALSSVYINKHGQLIDDDSSAGVVDAINKQTEAIKEQTQAVKSNKTAVHVHNTWKGSQVSLQNMQNFIRWMNNNI